MFTASSITQLTQTSLCGFLDELLMIKALTGSDRGQWSAELIRTDVILF